MMSIKNAEHFEPDHDFADRDFYLCSPTGKTIRSARMVTFPLVSDFFCIICNSNECCSWKRKSKCKLHLRNSIKKCVKEWSIRNIEKIKIKAKKYYSENRVKIYEKKKKLLNLKPYLKTLQNIRYRCNNPNDKKFKHYGGRGIKCFLNSNDIKEIWIRDKANEMKQPSIDRIDVNGHYEFRNCRYIEMSLNRARGFFCAAGSRVTCKGDRPHPGGTI